MVAEILTQIDKDSDEPVAAAKVDAESAPIRPEPEIIPITNKKPEPVYDKMPALDLSEYDDMKPVSVQESDSEPEPEPIPEPVEVVKETADPKPEKVTAKEAEASAAEVAEEIEKAINAEKPEYRFPPIDLLKLPGGGFADGQQPAPYIPCDAAPCRRADLCGGG